MSLNFRAKQPAWLVVLILAMAFAVALDFQGVRRTNFVTGIAADARVIEDASLTGYAKARRWLIVPEHDNGTYQWIGDTQRMLARGQWRTHRTEQENAPFGREVHVASVYRWWLLAVASVGHVFAHVSWGLALEQAALYANPAIQIIALVILTLWVARIFGVGAAVVVSLGLSVLYPLGSSFVPGVASDYSLSELAAFGSVVLLLCGIARPQGQTRWFVFAGMVAGGGLWISATTEAMVIAGIFLGGLFALLTTRFQKPDVPRATIESLPWRAWALAGGTTCLLAYLIEYYPGQMDLRFQVNHPLYGFAWLGLGELLHQFGCWSKHGKKAVTVSSIILSIVALGAVIGFPVSLAYAGIKGPIVRDLSFFRLSNQPDAVVATSFGSWFSRDQFSFPLMATTVALALLAVPLWMILNRKFDLRVRYSLALTLGPVLLLLGFAFEHVREWNLFDTALLACAIPTTAAFGNIKSFSLSRWIWIASLGTVFFVGLLELITTAASVKPDRLTKAEIAGLDERAIAHFVADHNSAANAVVLIPPYRTASFVFYGELKGIGSPDWENHDGLAATVRLASATRLDEAEALANERAVTNIILPSWDEDLLELAKLSLGKADDSFISKLQHGLVFDWLRPVPYKLPSVGGFDEQSVTLFEVTPDVDRSVSISRLTEYLIEMQQLQFVTAGRDALRHYPGDLGAIVAIAGAEKALGDNEAFAKVFKGLLSNLATGSDRNLLWDRRVSLAVVLTLGERRDLARQQVQRCLNEIDADKLRFLTTGTLYHFDVLCKLYGLQITDPKLHELSRSLLPTELQSRL